MNTSCLDGLEFNLNTNRYSEDSHLLKLHMEPRPCELSGIDSSLRRTLVPHPLPCRALPFLSSPIASPWCSLPISDKPHRASPSLISGEPRHAAPSPSPASLAAHPLPHLRWASPLLHLQQTSPHLRSAPVGHGHAPCPRPPLREGSNRVSTPRLATRRYHHRLP